MSKKSRKRKQRQKQREKYNMLKNHSGFVPPTTTSIFGKIGKFFTANKPIDPDKHPLGREAYLKLMKDVEENIEVLPPVSFKKGKSNIIYYK